MAKKQLYDILHMSKVQDANEFLDTKRIEFDGQIIFEFFSIIQSSGYCMIEQGSFTILQRLGRLRDLQPRKKITK